MKGLSSRDNFVNKWSCSPFSSSYFKERGVAVVNGTDLFSEAEKLFAGAWPNGTKLQATEDAAHKQSPTTRAGALGGWEHFHCASQATRHSLRGHVEGTRTEPLKTPGNYS